MHAHMSTHTNTHTQF